MISSFAAAYGQTEKEQYMNWFDYKIGEENSDLYNGTIYVNRFSNNDDSHQFFGANVFSYGCVTYNDQTYCNQRLKYDLFLDQLLTTTKTGSDKLTIQLRKNLVDSFMIDGHRFTRIGQQIDDGTDLGFVEMLAKNNAYVLLKKSVKLKSKKISGGRVFYEFKEKNVFLILHNQNYNRIKKIKDWVSIFPNYKKIIQANYKAYDELRKSDPTSFMKLLFTVLVNKSNYNLKAD